jgi:hypothetical protein
MLRKRKIIDLPNVYTTHAFRLDGQMVIGAGSEQNYPVYLINPDNNELIKIADGPGGMMSLLPIPGHAGHLISVMGLFPPFVGQEAGIYIHRLRNNEWATRKVIDLPFAHRCEILSLKGDNHLFIATVSKHKDNPADWSRPGELHYVKIADTEFGNWKTEVILDHITRNHGMTKTRVAGMESICISGAEGIFSIQTADNHSWQAKQLFEHEVSDFAWFDLDHDGEDELVTIEPFHGNTLNIYRKISSAWGLRYTSPLSFGHGLSVGIFRDQPAIAVGNRRDSEALEMHVVHNLTKSEIERIIVEEHVGPTQTQIFRHNETDYILSANQAKNEIALYN